MQRRTKLLFLLSAPLLVISACATGYQKEGVFSNGYSDYRLSDDTFVVTFRANEHTPPEIVMQYALKRASKLALKNGFNHFAILDKIDSSTKGKNLHYPSLRITIQCFPHKPLDRETIDARHFLTLHGRE